MIESTKGSLVFVRSAGSVLEVFWRGKKLTHVVGVTVQVHEDDELIKLRVRDPAGEQDAAYAELGLAGIAIKKVN